jgi:hypothetical protein
MSKVLPIVNDGHLNFFPRRERTSNNVTVEQVSSDTFEVSGRAIEPDHDTARRGHDINYTERRCHFEVSRETQYVVETVDLN